jgi:predicted transcriptional regulator of viral defense system
MNIVTDYFLRRGVTVFTQSDVATVLSGSKHRRHALVKRALAKGEILSIRRGLYCLPRPYQKRPLRIHALAQQIYGPSYVSFESALHYHGWIPEAVYTCTCASIGKAKSFETPLGRFDFQRVPQRVFYLGVDRDVDESGNVAFIATPAKALADYVYLHKPPWDTIEGASGSLRIETEDLLAVSPKDLAELEENYTNKRVRAFLRSWRMDRSS